MGRQTRPTSRPAQFLGGYLLPWNKRESGNREPLAVTHSVSQAMVGDGDQYPHQPRVDVTQTYDGAGQPGKRVQISRQNGIIDEFGNQSPPLEDTQTTYYIRSSVLGGAVIVEFVGANSLVHIYAGGQRIARESWGSVSFEHYNAVTGSWLRSHGHFSYRTTDREERDPSQAEIPLSNPYTYAGNYVDMKFGEPLFIEGGDPFDYVSGATYDGMPMSKSQLVHHLGKVGGNPMVLVDEFKKSKRQPSSEYPWRYTGSYLRELPQVGKQAQIISAGKARDPQQVPFERSEIESGVNSTLSTQSCRDFASRILNAVATKRNPLLENGNMAQIFQAFLAQPKGGYTRMQPAGAANYGSIRGLIKNGDAQIFAQGYPSRSVADQTDFDVIVVTGELFHLAGRNAWYTDRALAEAAHDVPEYASKSRLRHPTVFDADFPVRFAEAAARNPNHPAWSSYFHDIERQFCPGVIEDARGKS